jgi:hypothetical protein
VPAGVTSASFDLFGAQGGAGISGGPGLGGHAAATIPLTAGDSIQVNVGGRGANSTGVGGFNGGGNGPDKGGGGATDIRIGGTTLNQRVLVAGGGGGGGGCTNNAQNSDGGGGGGLVGADGFTPPFCSQLGVAGGGGTPSAGGSATSPATMGTFGSGGNAGNAAVAFSPGGGGGGWYGGGGGFSVGAGGGGSGHGPAGTSFETGVHSGDGQVTITYTATSCGSVKATATSYRPKVSLTPTVPGVRAWVYVDTSSQLLIDASLQVGGKSISLGTFTQHNTGKKKLRIAIPKKLRGELPLGTKVDLVLEINTTPDSAPACASKNAQKVTVHTKVVHILKNH